VGDIVFYRISIWRRRTGSCNNLSFSDKVVDHCISKNQLDTKTADLVRQWETYFYAEKTGSTYSFAIIPNKNVVPKPKWGYLYTACTRPDRQRVTPSFTEHLKWRAITGSGDNLTIFCNCYRLKSRPIKLLPVRVCHFENARTCGWHYFIFLSGK